ncbi:hypothetical protein N780_01810 [Pontibacillus chungwhensis BH030062]|uniref:ATPase n=1 Tax=Pontibacillus chungwhensis BH030062 TaxID=1385513 RepID=A0A0A2V0T7_9BACI|nr:hypothetical protein [Pontibacillus chungwhensis]KGP92391.1 hypothetical protein N780_01810 [Pontibacillus chungwhensis BH030062]
MNVIWLLIAILVLLVSLTRLTRTENNKPHSVFEDIKTNVRLLLYGIPILVMLAYIPYQVWVITGKSNGWGVAYVMGGTAFITIVISLVFYYRIKLRFN